LIEKQTRERAHLQSFIDRFRAKATKARQAQSRMKMLAKMEDLAPLHVAAPFSFEFKEPDRAPNPLLVLEDVVAGYADKTVLTNVKLSLQSEQRIGLLGVNGAGKSTLIKTIAGVLPVLSGSAVFNKGLQVGYFAQHQVEMLRDDQSPLWHLKKLAPEVREQDLRNYLGSFNFPGEMATGPVEHFSGGEKARLALALIVWQKPNLLLLDEPTNHLDLETREALAVALAQFEGTLVLVSHDRHLLRATTDQFLIVANGTLQAFDGASLTIGAVVGTGIFLTAGDVARSLPHPVLVLGVWLTGGLLVLAGALAYAEMGAMYPHAGGLYHFLRAAWGPLPAFLYGWTCLMVIMTGGIAAIAVGFGDYLGALVPTFSSERTVWAVGALHVSGAQLAALLAIVALTATNHFGVRQGASVQNLFTLAKLGAIAALVVGGVLTPARVPVDWGAPLPAAPFALAVPFGVALIATLWTYDGWYALTFSAGEVRDPSRDLPRGLLLGVAIVIVAYAALNLVYLRALGVGPLAKVV